MTVRKKLAPKPKVSAHEHSWERWIKYVGKQTGLLDSRGQTTSEGNVDKMDLYLHLYLYNLDEYMEADPHYLGNRVHPTTCPLCKMPYPKDGRTNWYPCASNIGTKRIIRSLEAAVARVEDAERLKKEREITKRAMEMGVDPDELREPVEGTIPMAFAEMEDVDEEDQAGSAGWRTKDRR